MEDLKGEKSSTGGLDGVYGPEDENGEMRNAPMAEPELANDDDGSEGLAKKGRKLQVNSGQLNSKMDDENLSQTEMADELKRSSISQKNNFNTI